MAINLHAWVYPFISIPVYEKSTSVCVGALSELGEMCFVSEFLDDSGKPKTSAVETFEKQKTALHKELKALIKKRNISIDEKVLGGRDVILVADSLQSTAQLLAANSMLAKTHPKSISVTIGNANNEVAQLAHRTTDRAIILDVISGVMHANARYFTHGDEYNDSEKATLISNIVTYWR